MTSPRPETLNRLTDIVFDKVMRTLRTPDKTAPLYELLSEMMTRLDNELDLPLRISATVPESTKLLIRSNRVTSGDGGERSLPPDATDFNVYPDTTIDLDTGVIIGGTVKRNGLTFSLPNVTVGQYVRLGLSYVDASNIVDTAFSSASVSLSGLTAVGTLLDTLEGTKIGYIDLESDGVSSFKTPGAVSGFIYNTVSGVSYIHRFISGGGGSGTGDASTIRTGLENQLQESTYQLLTAVDFAIDRTDYVSGTSTGTYSSGSFDFAVSGQNYVSVNMFDSAEFLADPAIPNVVDLTVFWDLAALDTAAVYEVSRNGGANYQTISMLRNGLGTNAYSGRLEFATEADTSIGSNSAAQTSGYELNATTQLQSQSSFTLAVAGVLRNVDLLSVVKTGSPTGSYFVDICLDSAGAPGNVISSSAAQAVSGVVSGTVTVDVSDVALKASTTYWVLVRTDAVYKSIFSTGVTSLTMSLNGSGLRRDFKGYPLDLRVRIASSAASKSILGLGIFYLSEIGKIVGGSMREDTKSFLTTANTFSFALNFLPDAQLLRVYHVETGQVYTFPAFTLSGATVNFPTGTFYSVVSETVTLKFVQIEGTSFDTSDRNGSLLASNFLGSTDASIDRSASGRGIFLRRPDGVLREIVIQNDDSLAIYSV
jgi:hypothetical protein